MSPKFAKYDHIGTLEYSIEKNIFIKCISSVNTLRRYFVGAINYCFKKLYHQIFQSFKTLTQESSFYLIRFVNILLSMRQNIVTDEPLTFGQLELK